MSHGSNGKGRMIRLPKSRLALEVPQEPSRDLMDVLRMIEESEAPPQPRTLPKRISDPPAVLQRLPMPRSGELAPPQPLVRRASFQTDGGYDPTFRRKAGGVGDYFNPGQRTGRATQEATGQDGTLIESGMVTQTNGVTGPSGSTYAGEVRYLPQGSLGGAPASVSEDTSARLNQLSQALGAPVLVLSGSRTPEQNKDVGGATSSAHVTGEGGVDIWIEGMTKDEIARAVQATGLFGRVNYYDDRNGVHLDDRTPKGNGIYHNWVFTPFPDE